MATAIVRTVITRASTLLACLLALGVLASGAQAEVPSVDAYGGEALVLGHPHKHHGGGNGGSQRTRTGESSHAQGGSSALRRSAGESSGEASTPSGETGGSEGGSTHSGTSSHGGNLTSPPSHGHGQTGAGINGKANGHVDKSASGKSNGGSIASGTAAKGGGQALVNSKSVAMTGASESAFSAGDLLLILLGVACIAGIGVALRVARRTA